MRFILSNGKTVNSYGFRVKTSGIGLKRFKANPVMLSEHNYGAVIGKWEAVELDKEKEQLSADAVFDMEDWDAEKLAGKVERGFINGASVGLSFNPEDFKLIDGEMVLTKSELIEASICAIPSDASALRLYYADSEKPMSDAEVGKLCLSFHASATLSNQGTNFKQENMNAIKLSVQAIMALGLSGSKTEFEQSEIEVAILAKDQEYAALKVANEAYQAKEAQAQAALCTSLVDEALKAGKITADKKESFLKMAKVDYALAKDTLDGIPSKQTYSKGLGGENTGIAMKLEDFCKMPLQEQLAWKESNLEAYKAMVR